MSFNPYQCIDPTTPEPLRSCSQRCPVSALTPLYLSSTGKLHLIANTTQRRTMCGTTFGHLPVVYANLSVTPICQRCSRVAGVGGDAQ